MEGIGEEVESMEDTVSISDSGLCEVVVGGVNNVEATVVLEGRSDVEAIVAAEGPGITRARFVVDNDRVSDGADGSVVEVEGAVIVFPGGHFRAEGGLSKEI